MNYFIPYIRLYAHLRKGQAFRYTDLLYAYNFWLYGGADYTLPQGKCQGLFFIYFRNNLTFLKPLLGGGFRGRAI